MTIKKLIIGTGIDWSGAKAQLIKDYPENEFIGLDIIPQFKPDIVRDVLRGLPFNDNEFDGILVEHVLEHISGMLACQPMDNFVFVMNEIYRVLKPGGSVDIEVPYWKDDIAVEASGHTRFFAQNSFINFYENPCSEELGMSQFSEVVSCDIVASGRSPQESRVLKIKLKK